MIYFCLCTSAFSTAQNTINSEAYLRIHEILPSLIHPVGPADEISHNRHIAKVRRPTPPQANLPMVPPFLVHEILYSPAEKSVRRNRKGPGRFRSNWSGNFRVKPRKSKKVAVSGFPRTKQAIHTMFMFRSRCGWSYALKGRSRNPLWILETSTHFRSSDGTSTQGFRRSKYSTKGCTPIRKIG